MLRFALALACILALAPAATHAAAAVPVPIHLVASPADGIVPVLYAQRTGMFAKAGLDVSVEKMSAGAGVTAVMGGAADLGKTGIVSIITAHVRNVPLVIVAPAAIYDPKTPDAVLAVKAGSPLTTMNDVAGKTIAVTSLGDISQIAVQAWFAKNGVDARSTQFVEVSLPATAAALEAGRVDAAILIKPFITEAVDSGAVRVLNPVYGAIGSRFLESVWYGNRDFMTKHPDAVAAFARVLAVASHYVNSHLEETGDLLASFTGIDLQRATHGPRIVTGETLRAADIQPVIDAMVHSHALAAPFAARDVMWP